MKNLQHVRGMEKDIYFVRHQDREEIEIDALASWCNLCEAQFMIDFSGYRTYQITVLAFYKGQALEIRRFLEGAWPKRNSGGYG